MSERKTRLVFNRFGWKTIRAAASFGDADLICIKKGRCVLLQVKSTKKEKFYYYQYMEPTFEGFPFYLVVDFGYGKIRITPPKKIITTEEGEDLEEFLSNIK